MTLRSICFALVLGICSCLASADPDTRQLDEVVLRSELGQFWGAVLVAKDGRSLLAKGYGCANDSLAPIDSKTLFDIGSIAKQFTAALALKLHSENRLSLDEPINTYFPELPASAKQVTLRHLLTHTSGLSDGEGAIQQLDFPDRDEAVRLAFKKAANLKPGEKFEYCNGGYCIAAAIIERAAGGPFQALMREEIFKPAGLVNTGFLDGDGLDLSNATARVVSGRTGEVRRTILQDGWGWGLRGCGGILMSLEDIVRWDVALRSNSIFDAEARNVLYTPSLENYGLGWFVESTGTDKKVWHSGGTRGYRAYLLRIPARAITIVVLTNDKHDPIGLGKKLLEELLPEERGGIRGALHLDGLKLNEHKAAVIDRDVRINIDQNVRMPDGPPTRLDVSVAVPATARTEGRVDAVTFTMMPGPARRIASEIRSILKSKPRSQQTAAGIEATIATAAYTPIDHVVQLPPEVQVVVLPRYSGVGSDGQSIVDERVCVVLMDEANGFWPVILKLDRVSAASFADQLDPGPRP